MTVIFALTIIGSLTALALYRVFFHPLSQFPGPRLAAITGWYETYFDCLCGGTIVRINPWELHIRDPSFFDHFYTSDSKLSKDPWYYNFPGIPRSTFATSPTRLHRPRRAAISRAFAISPSTSKQIESCVERLIKRLRIKEGAVQERKAVRFSNVFWMLASDVVTSCMMPRGTTYTTFPERAPHYPLMFKYLAKVALWSRHFPRLFNMLSTAPHCLANMAAQPVQEALRIQDDIKDQIKLISESHLNSKDNATSLPHHLLDSKLSTTDKCTSRLVEEITMIIGAGTEAVGAALSITVYHLLTHPIALTKIKAELLEAAQHLQWPVSIRVLEQHGSSGDADSDTKFLPSLARSDCHISTDNHSASMASTTISKSSVEDTQVCQLKNLQNPRRDLAQIDVLPYSLLRSQCAYLAACIKEGLRLSKESNRMPRISSVPIIYHNAAEQTTHVIPAGTVVSMSLRDVHLHPSVFPAPHTFNPERWLGKDSSALENYLVPFGKGTRSCPGRALAIEEIFVTIGNLFYHIDMKLWDTSEEDMTAAHDFFSGSETGREGGLTVLLK
ncbi:MAG: hypothetical protein Q9204_006763 [Flavoplaca sp. TL-2023a]